MAIVRQWQTGFEHNDVSEYIALNGSPSISTTKTRTGTYSLRTAQGSVYFVGDSVAQAMLSINLNHLGLASGASYAVLVSLYDGVTQVAEVRWYADGTLRAFCGGSQVESAAVATMNLENTWINIGVDFKLHNTTGWFYVYVDGVEEISYNASQTDQSGSSDFERFVIGNGPGDGTEKWDDYIYFDDCWWDSSVGESPAAAPTSYRYFLILPNADGNYSQFDGSDGNSVNNYELVDEIPPDNDTTYVTSDVDTERDSYEMGNYTIPVGSSIASVIPVAKARKESAGSSYGMTLFTRESATDGDGSKHNLGTGWAFIFERQPLDPGGGAWDQAELNAVEVGIKVTS